MTLKFIQFDEGLLELKRLDILVYSVIKETMNQVVIVLKAIRQRNSSEPFGSDDEDEDDNQVPFFINFSTHLLNSLGST